MPFVLTSLSRKRILFTLVSLIINGLDDSVNPAPFIFRLGLTILKGLRYYNEYLYLVDLDFTN